MPPPPSTFHLDLSMTKPPRDPVQKSPVPSPLDSHRSTTHHTISDPGPSQPQLGQPQLEAKCCHPYSCGIYKDAVFEQCSPHSRQSLKALKSTFE